MPPSGPEHTTPWGGRASGVVERICPAVYRLEHQGLIAGEWGQSENRR